MDLLEFFRVLPSFIFQKKYADKPVWYCIFNTMHVVPMPEKTNHFQTCPDRFELSEFEDCMKSPPQGGVDKTVHPGGIGPGMDHTTGVGEWHQGATAPSLPAIQLEDGRLLFMLDKNSSDGALPPS